MPAGSVDDSGSGDAEAPALTYPKALRLRRTAEFRRVYDSGHKQVGRHIIVWVLPNELDHFRAGAVASKKVGKAPLRNRAKRRIRELFRTHQHQLAPGWDVVAVSRYTVPGVDWDILVKDFRHVCKRAGIFQERDEGAAG